MDFSVIRCSRAPVKKLEPSKAETPKPEPPKPPAPPAAKPPAPPFCGHSHPPACGHSHPPAPCGHSHPPVAQPCGQSHPPAKPPCGHSHPNMAPYMGHLERLSQMHGFRSLECTQGRTWRLNFGEGNPHEYDEYGPTTVYYGGHSPYMVPHGHHQMLPGPSPCQSLPYHHSGSPLALPPSMGNYHPVDCGYYEDPNCSIM